MFVLYSASARSPPYRASREVAQCLDNAEIVAAGPSELANIVGWLTGGDTSSTRRNTRALDRQEQQLDWPLNRLAASRSLRCHTMRNLGDRHFTCFGEYRRRAACRERLYSERPFLANCTGDAPEWRGARFRVAYYWRSFQSPSHVDAALLHRASLARQQGRRVIIVLSNGLQTFAQFADHDERLLHNVAADFAWPQPWIDEWLNQTLRQFRLYASGQPRSSWCVAWCAQNVAPRHSNASEPRHHPSALNGVHHWINRMSAALARQHGLAVIDLINATLSQTPLDRNADTPDSAGRTQAKKTAEALEGDVYHGYRSARGMGPLFLRALAAACC